MQIGELARRTGVSPELLRAWEQRYGLLRPERSPGGFRLYSADDEERVRRTAALIAQGVSAAEAARLARTGPGASAPEQTEPDGSLVAALAAELRGALDRFDTGGATDALDRLFGTVSVDYAITQVLIPYLHELGERWAAGTASVAQEHFASQLVRGRLLGVAAEWGVGNPESVVLACLPGEAHDLGLVMFGLLLVRRGWHVTFLGADTPMDTLAASVPVLRPSLVVLGTYDADRFRANREAVARLAAMTRVAMFGQLEPDEVTQVGAELLVNDIARAAENLRVPH